MKKKNMCSIDGCYNERNRFDQLFCEDHRTKWRIWLEEFETILIPEELQNRFLSLFYYRQTHKPPIMQDKYKK